MKYSRQKDKYNLKIDYTHKTAIKNMNVLISMFIFVDYIKGVRIDYNFYINGYICLRISNIFAVILINSRNINTCFARNNLTVLNINADVMQITKMCYS